MSDHQLELFQLDPDNRVERLKSYLRSRLELNPKWKPTAKEIVTIGDGFKVVGRKPLTLYMELKNGRA